MMNLAKWLYDWPLKLPSDVTVKGINNDTRLLQPGEAFIALSGWQFDGKQFINQAIALGASVVIAETEGQAAMDYVDGVLVLSWPDLSQWLSELSARFYYYCSTDLSIIGVTGTNGKTSIAYLLSQALANYGSKCAYSGTLGQGAIDQLHQSTYGMTTPDAIEVQRLLASWQQAGYDRVSMEVSSHGLALGRVNAVPFKGAIFSNLSHDHLDFHANLEDYIAAKASLFAHPELNYIILNADDPYSESMRQAAIDHPFTQKCYYNIRSTVPVYAETYVQVDDYQLGVDGIKARVTSSWGRGELVSSLLGEFNLSNLLAVLSALCLEGVSWSQALQLVSRCKPVPGRMETIQQQGKPHIIIDFAHTPDALDKMLRAVRQLNDRGQLHCVFGCGGDRDRQKRPWMAQIASQYADYIWLTVDNSRSESPQSIINDMQQGISDGVTCYTDLNRTRAINRALQTASKQDVVVIAGKGHECYTNAQGETIDFSDVDAVYSCLDNATP